ncbi:hypothetical protein CsSME_00031414 [Camellia sinensis var. sinensis]
MMQCLMLYYELQWSSFTQIPLDGLSTDFLRILVT